MNEFLPRTESVPAVSRVAEPRRIVQAASGASAPQMQARGDVHSDPQAAERSAISATYAQLRADIANVLAELQPRRRPADAQVGQADEALLGLMPQPIIVLPMPPTDPQMLAFVAQVAQSVAQHSAHARAAQANAPAILAPAILASDIVGDGATR
ncbi:MAG TPA: hypothetical protein VNS79_09925 [Sphingobium sp.]|nr:hypothetical protein [Sphingobium sp.]